MRSKLGIAIQAVGVAALGAIVYLAFLSPEDSGPLSGIDVHPPVESQPPERAAQPKAGEPARSRPPAERTAVRVARSDPPPLPPVIEDAPDTPAGSQYSGTVARILGQVAGSRR